MPQSSCLFQPVLLREVVARVKVPLIAMTAHRTDKAEVQSMAQTVRHIVEVVALLTGLMERVIVKVAIQPIALMGQATAVAVIQPTVLMEQYADKSAIQLTAIKHCHT